MKAMTTYPEVPVADGGSSSVEVDDARSGGSVVRSGRHAESVNRACEFGLRLNTEVGAVIARTGGEAKFGISLRRSRE
jgi:hypothetical protein